MVVVIELLVRCLNTGHEDRLARILLQTFITDKVSHKQLFCSSKIECFNMNSFKC